jgi:hypothetical protein
LWPLVFPCPKNSAIGPFSRKSGPLRHMAL